MEKKRFNARRIGRWLGGYVRDTKHGKQVFVIELWRRGRKWHVSTGQSTKRAAEKELERFELDPMSYVPDEGLTDANIVLDAELVLAFRAHQLSIGVTREWADQVARNLADWQIALKGRDLRTLKLHRDLKPILNGWTTQVPHRIKAIKGLFRWLREHRGLVDRAQDATLDLRVPQARPEKLKRRKVVDPEDVAAVLKVLPRPTKDILHLMTGTAWHQSEVRKFHAGGEVVLPMKAEGVLAVLITRHKSGDLIKTPVIYPEHLAAAERIRQLKRFPDKTCIARHMRLACREANVPPFSSGQMRHSVLTWAVRDGGASVDAAKEFANHRSEATTKRYYLDLDIPKNSVPVYRLSDEVG